MRNLNAQKSEKSRHGHPRAAKEARSDQPQRPEGPQDSNKEGAFLQQDSTTRQGIPTRPWAEGPADLYELLAQLKGNCSICFSNFCFCVCVAIFAIVQ